MLFPAGFDFAKDFFGYFLSRKESNSEHCAVSLENVLLRDISEEILRWFD